MVSENRKECKTAARKRRFVLAITFFTVVLAGPLPARQLRFDLEAITLGGDYQVGVARKEGVNSIKGYGGGASVRFRVHEYAALLVGVGYGELDISEIDPITKWDWEYWKRLYRNHVVSLLGDSAYFNGRLESLRNITAERLTAGKWVGKDSLYSVQLTPVQYMNIIPVSLSFAFTFPLTENLQVDAYAGSTLLVFERNLFLDEQWTKRRMADAGPVSGNLYVFSYGYRNFAPPKTGTVLGVGGGVALQWKVLSAVTVQVGGRYETYDLLRSSDSDLVPFRQRLALGAGVAVYY